MVPGTSFVINGALALVLMPLVSLLKKENWSRSAKFSIALVLSLIAAVATMFITSSVGQFSWDNFGVLAAAAIAQTQVFYNLFFKNSELDSFLTQVGTPLKQAALETPMITAALFDSSEEQRIREIANQVVVALTPPKINYGDSASGLVTGTTAPLMNDSTPVG